MPRLEFDRRISLGNILTAVSIVLTAVVLGGTGFQKFGALEQRVAGIEKTVDLKFDS